MRVNSAAEPLTSWATLVTPVETPEKWVAVRATAHIGVSDLFRAIASISVHVHLVGCVTHSSRSDGSIENRPDRLSTAIMSAHRLLN